MFAGIVKNARRIVLRTLTTERSKIQWSYLFYQELTIIPNRKLVGNLVITLFGKYYVGTDILGVTFFKTLLGILIFGRKSELWTKLVLGKIKHLINFS